MSALNDCYESDVICVRNTPWRITFGKSRDQSCYGILVVMAMSPSRIADAFSIQCEMYLHHSYRLPYKRTLTV
jgi:hypothetical protein